MTQEAVRRAVAVFDGSPSKLAGAIGEGVRRQHVEHWLKSGRIPPEHCAAVESLTRVHRWDLRHDDWHRIWPELVGTPGAPNVDPATVRFVPPRLVTTDAHPPFAGLTPLVRRNLAGEG